MRVFCFARALAILIVSMSLAGCAHQYGHILAKEDKDLVGSHAAGAATWNPLVDEAVAKLLGRCPPAVQAVAFEGADYRIDSASAIGSALATILTWSHPPEYGLDMFNPPHCWRADAVPPVLYGTRNGAEKRYEL